MHNDFHNTHGIFPLFDGLQVQDMEKPLHTVGTTPGTPNGQPKEETNEEADTLKIGEKSKIDIATDTVKSTASAITNGLNSLKLSN